jgi:hypothetical protein
MSISKASKPFPVPKRLRESLTKAEEGVFGCMMIVD